MNFISNWSTLHYSMMLYICQTNRCDKITANRTRNICDTFMCACMCESRAIFWMNFRHYVAFAFRTEKRRKKTKTESENAKVKGVYAEEKDSSIKERNNFLRYSSSLHRIRFHWYNLMKIINARLDVERNFFVCLFLCHHFIALFLWRKKKRTLT